LSSRSCASTSLISARTSEMLEIYGLGFVFASLLGLLSGVFMISTQA